MRKMMRLVRLLSIPALVAAGAPGRPDALTAERLLATASQRIEQHRKGDFTIVVMDDGRRVPGAVVEVAQTDHEFLFGCNIFGLRPAQEAPLQQAYQERFAALFNYATLPFYWGSYESEQGKPRTEALKAMARWCEDHSIRPKGHPLVWHQAPPAWAPWDTSLLAATLRGRVRSIVSGFAGLVDTWDVINESTVSARANNPVGQWVKQVGDVQAAGEALSWAREANTLATLILNDFNVSQAYHKQIQGLIDAGRAPDAIGIQSHMHKGEWPIERVWQVCETYASFGRPLHFTETTVLSGRLKADDDWSRYRTDWLSTPEGERRQAEYVEKLYRVLFSHPAVAAITWWDLSDLGSWQGAPAGLLRKDMSPKPAYQRLLGMIKGQWWTQVRGRTDSGGKMTCRGFYGRYRVTATAADGRMVSRDVRLFKADAGQVTLRLPAS